MTARRDAVLQLDSRMLTRDTIGTTDGFGSSIDQSLPAFVSMSASSPMHSVSASSVLVGISTFRLRGYHGQSGNYPLLPNSEFAGKFTYRAMAAEGWS